MQEQIIHESYSYLNDLRTRIEQSNTLVNIFKDFVRNIHQSFRTLSMQLTEHSEQLYTQMARNPEENELNLFHYNQITNSVVNFTHQLNDMLDEMWIGTIEPFELFSQNYEQVNSNLLKEGDEFLKMIEKQRETLHNKQQEYLKTSYDLEKKKKSKTLKLKADDLFIDYRQELSITNQLWDEFNLKFKTQFEEFDSNELGRTHLTQITSNQIISQLSSIFIKSYENLQQTQVSQQGKLNLIIEKHNKEKQPILKHISRNRKFNIFRITKQDNFISYDDWKGINHEKFDPNNLQKYKLEQTLENQINTLIEYFKLISQESGQIKQIQYDFDTLFSHKQVRVKLFDNIENILDQAPTDQINIDLKQWDMSILVARNLIINLQKEQDLDIQEFYKLLIFMISYGRREKNQFISLGSVASEKTSLFYERHNWQQLLLYLNEKEVVKNEHKLQRRINTKEVLGMLYQKKRKIKEELTQDQKLQYLKVLSNLQKISSIMLKMDIKVDFACETMIVLAKMCNIRVQDIVLLLEQFEHLKIYVEQVQSNDKNSDRQYKSKTYQIFKKILPYLTLHDQLKISSLCKDTRLIQKKIIQYYLSFNQLGEGQKRKMLWIQALQPYKVNLDYYKLKEKYSRSAGSKEAQLEQLIAQDVQRSFNSAGIQSRVNHLTLHNLLKLYAFYNNTISYTQGMNFVMGFIYTTMEDEELTFRCFTSLVDNYLKDVLIYDLKYIRVFYYKLDRLLAICLPNIHQHLKDEKIEAGHFSAPWFITFFSGSFMKNQFSTTLYDIWDLLLSKGWSGFYQILMAIFETYEEKILSMKFDSLMQFLNNLAKAEFFTQNADEMASLKTLKYRALRFRISNKLLQDIDKEYYLVRQKINLLMNY